MGLDMYLKAECRYGLGDPRLGEVLLAARTDLETLREHSAPGEPHYGMGVYLGGWGHFSDDERQPYSDVLSIMGLPSTPDSPSMTLRVEGDEVVVDSTAIYWRKANAIHAWFVDNCQDGVDECEPHEVHPEQLAQLRQVCQDALDAYEAGDLDKAREILEPRSGFFFGSTDLDEWWAEDVRRTIAEIEALVRQAVAIGGVRFIYQSSW